MSAAAGDQIEPSIVADGLGGAIMVWKDHRGFNFDVYAQRLNASGTPLWTAGGVAICTANGEHDHPVLVADGTGGAIVPGWITAAPTTTSMPSE